MPSVGGDIGEPLLYGLRAPLTETLVVISPGWLLAAAVTPAFIGQAASDALRVIGHVLVRVRRPREAGRANAEGVRTSLPMKARSERVSGMS